MSASENMQGETQKLLLSLFQVLDSFDQAWRRYIEEQTTPPSLKEFQTRLNLAFPDCRREGFRWLLQIELEYRRKLGENPSEAEYVRSFPDFYKEISQVFGPKGSPSTKTLEESIEGNRIDHYILEHCLGVGGMGVVYQAYDTRLRRTVAIKLLRTGTPTSAEEHARFQTEAEVLAQLDHPGIVPIFECGVFRQQPFLVLGFVSGKTLQQIIAQGPLDPDNAAQLVRQCALAIHYAHTQGVIHRDLKPSNVLLEWSQEDEICQDSQKMQNMANARIRITDFGLAKLVCRQGDTLTQTDQVLGTPSYMAPEQARGDHEQVGPATDVYALGAILYACLTGRPPFQAASPLETLRQVESEEPVPLRALNSQVPRDLETIVLKCLQKSPQRRYKSAQALAEDLRRYLENEPILARPVGAGERVLRWCQRNPKLAGLLALTSVLMLVLSIGGPWMAWYQLQLRHQADAARNRAQRAILLERQAKEAERTARRLAEKRQKDFKESLNILLDVFSDLDLTNPGQVQKEQENAVSLPAQLASGLLRAAEQLEKGNFSDPVALARLRARLAVTLIALGYARPAQELLASSVKVLRQHLGPYDDETFMAEYGLAYALHRSGPLQEAERFTRQLYKKQKDYWGPDHPNALKCQIMLAEIYMRSGKVSEAKQTLEEIIKHTQSQSKKLPKAKRHIQIELAATHQLALTLVAQGELAEAQRILERILPLLKRLLGFTHPTTIRAYSDLIDTYKLQGRYEKAIACSEEFVKLAKKTYGPRHPQTLRAMSDLGILYGETERHDEAKLILNQVYETYSALVGPEHENTLRSAINLARAYSYAGQFHKALNILNEVAPIIKSRFGKKHPITFVVMNNLASVYWGMGDHDRAIAMYQEVLKLRIQVQGKRHIATIETMMNLGKAYSIVGMYQKAIPLLEESVQLARELLGPGHPRTLGAAGDLVLGYVESGKLEEAFRALQVYLPMAQKSLGSYHYVTVYLKSYLAEVYRMTGNPRKAIEIMEEVVKHSNLTLGETDRLTVERTNNLGLAYMDAGELLKARKIFERLLFITKGHLGDNNMNTVRACINLCLVYERLGKFELAIPLWQEAYRARRNIFGPYAYDTLAIAWQLALAYGRIGKAREAEYWVAVLIDGFRRGKEKNLPDYSDYLLQATQLMLMLKKFHVAEYYARECLEVLRNSSSDSRKIFFSLILVGCALLEQGRYEEAEKFLLEGYRFLKNNAGKVDPATFNRCAVIAITNLIKLYKANKDPERVSFWEKELENVLIKTKFNFSDQ